MENIIFTSLLLLTIFILSFLYWLSIKTIKEGKEALKEINKDNK